MKVSSVFSYILSLVSLYAVASPLASQETSHETSLDSRAVPSRHGASFISAIDYNICHKEYGGWQGGFGYVTLETIFAFCRGIKDMRLQCRWTHPGRFIRAMDYTCAEYTSCMPTTIPGQPPDAGCIGIFQPSGVLGEGDMDNFACSSGVNIGARSLTFLSSITTDGSPAPAIARCSILQSGTQRFLWDHSPCEQQSFTITLSAHTSYQACISAAVGFIHHKVGFKWHLLPPGKLIRDVGDGIEDGTPLSELFTIDDTRKSGPVNVEIVVGN